MYSDIKEYVKTCHECRIRKQPNQRPFGNMQRIDATAPWEVLSFDHCGPMPALNQCKYILTTTDLHSNLAIAKAVSSKEARFVARFLFEDVILVYMLHFPEMCPVTSGTQFTTLPFFFLFPLFIVVLYERHLHFFSPTRFLAISIFFLLFHHFCSNSLPSNVVSHLFGPFALSQ